MLFRPLQKWGAVKYCITGRARSEGQPIPVVPGGCSECCLIVIE